MMILLSTDAVASQISCGDQAISSTSPECPLKVDVHLQVSTLTFPLELKTALLPTDTNKVITGLRRSEIFGMNPFFIL